MDSRVAKLKTPMECEVFAANARARGAPELAEQARKRAVQLRAQSHGAQSDVERECLEAVYAYEEILSEKRGRRQPAGRTWQMIHRHGVLPAVERIVTKRGESTGYSALAEMGLHEFAFEAVVLRNQQHFSEQAIACSRERLGEHGAA
ncbi:hypothetical protein [Ramlibacter sp.]|uniref:hypothetical protein n=1 Tax=Ramlibacter sp. TaxID=1917967 RepID=UPI002D5DA69B|nr:hypothetical protein [Ramlibacter sp.]HYD76037.1 hypothetical protein [Ramlibacter sp.]